MMRFSFHCNSTTGHLRIGTLCIVWRNAVPYGTFIYGNGYERLYNCFGETSLSWGNRSFLFH